MPRVAQDAPQAVGEAMVRRCRRRHYAQPEALLELLSTYDNGREVAAYVGQRYAYAHTGSPSPQGADYVTMGRRSRIQRRNVEQADGMQNAIVLHRTSQMTCALARGSTLSLRSRLPTRTPSIKLK